MRPGAGLTVMGSPEVGRRGGMCLADLTGRANRRRNFGGIDHGGGHGCVGGATAAGS